ncbi:MAG TPA: GIY-YIG nuclease family protein [Hyphomicrobiales bacterium]|jgi:hypothetical protein
MSVADNIRALAREGLGIADIARKLGIRYQHAYNVLKTRGKTQPGDSVVENARARRPDHPIAPKPTLKVDALLGGGFVLSARWVLTDGDHLTLDRPLPKFVGVYAFAKEDVVLYVGVATMGMAKRLYFYGKPGITQRTSLRLNRILRNELLSVPFIDIYTAMPPDLDWNGLPVHGSAGLELGLIKKYALPWNLRSAT